MKTLDFVSELFAGAADAIDLPRPLRDAAVARYGDVGTFLADAGGPRWSIYPQGSFLIGTSILPPDNAGDYDIDLVCHKDIDKQSTSQAELKDETGKMLEAYYEFKRASNASDAPDSFEENRRCWTLAYSALHLHLDVLPAIPDVEKPPTGILLTDTKLRPWQYSNPKGYADWFRSRSLEMIELLEAKAREAGVESVPDWDVRSNLQRLVQVLKWHCYRHFSQDVDDRPPSILITTLAARAFNQQGNLSDGLKQVVEDIPSHIEFIDGKWVVRNPAHEKENFADKWNYPETAHRREKFMSWLEEVDRTLWVARRAQGQGIDTLVAELSSSLDQRVMCSAASKVAERTVVARRSDAFGVNAGVGALGIGTARSTPQHTFFGLGHETD